MENIKIQQTTQRIFGLDLLRSLAVLGVLFLHAADCVPGVPVIINSIFLRGWMGVDLFFVLSGFLISEQILNVNFSIFQFWIKRWTRTIPLYWTVLFVYVVIKPLVFHFPFVGMNWKFLFFLQNIEPIKDFFQSWSLCIEEQFYFIFPLVYLIFKPKNILFWTLPLFFSVIFRVLTWHRLGLPVFNGIQLEPASFDYMIRSNTFAHLDSISVGVLLAASSKYWKDFSKKTKYALGIIGMFLFTLIAIPNLYSPGDFMMVLLSSATAISFGCIFIFLYDFKPFRFQSLNRVISKIALYSYGIYLWNPLFIRVFFHFPISQSWVLGVILFVVPVIVLSFLTYEWIEKPGLKLREYFRTRP